jgi:hypothetical protein
MQVEVLMGYRGLSLMLCGALLGLSADKGPPKGEAAGRQLKLEATAYLDKSAIQQAVGEEMEPGIVVIEVRLTPTGDSPMTISRDDFLLRSDKDGQRSTPYSPSQIAGTSVLVVSNRYGGGGIAAEDRGPVWGGLGGGRPSRMPGSGGGIGNSGGTAEAVTNVREGTGKDQEPPLLAALKKNILPERQISEPLTGQLYFLMDGKHKVKDLELLYRGSGEKLSIRFKQ